RRRRWKCFGRHPAHAQFDACTGGTDCFEDLLLDRAGRDFKIFLEIRGRLLTDRIDLRFRVNLYFNRLNRYTGVQEDRNATPLRIRGGNDTELHPLELIARRDAKLINAIEVNDEPAKRGCMPASQIRKIVPHGGAHVEACRWIQARIIDQTY